LFANALAAKRAGSAWPKSSLALDTSVAVLRGRVGTRLRAVATLGDQSQRTAKAVAWNTTNYAKPLLVEELAELASMGVSTLHHHFRALTAMSPLQYQKQLRLQSARSLMLNNGLDAASAAFEVGYESATQFNREYSRFFGQPPMRDIRAHLAPGASKLELLEASNHRETLVPKRRSSSLVGSERLVLIRLLCRLFPQLPIRRGLFFFGFTHGEQFHVARRKHKCLHKTESFEVKSPSHNFGAV
jgi:AraC-like DNA-binding protein